MRFATTASKTQCNCNVQEHAKHIEAAITLRTTPRLGRTQPAPAAHTRYLSLPAAATLHGKTHGFVLRLPPHNKPHATLMQPLQCVSQPQLPKTRDSKSATNYAHMNNHTLQNSKGEPITHRNGRSAPAAHRRYLSLPPAATLHGKTQGFVLRLPPQNTPHATWMQPLQCVLQHHMSNPHVSAHMATKRDSTSQVSTSLRHHFPKSPLP